MAIKWISIKALKVHEFNTTLRLLHKDSNTWMAKFDTLHELEKRAVKQFGILFGQLIIAYLLVGSLEDGNLLSITLGKITATVPLSYFLAVVSFLLLLTSIQLNHYSAILSARTRHGSKMILPGFSSEVLALIKENNDNALGIPIYINSFFKEIFPVSALLSISLILGIVSALLPIIAFGWFLGTKQLAIVLTANVNWLELASAFIGLLLAILSAVNIILFHIPLPLKKNSFQIRWGFLYKISDRSHPQAKKWVDE